MVEVVEVHDHGCGMVTEIAVVTFYAIVVVSFMPKSGSWRSMTMPKRCLARKLLRLATLKAQFTTALRGKTHDHTGILSSSFSEGPAYRIHRFTKDQDKSASVDAAKEFDGRCLLISVACPP